MNANVSPDLVWGIVKDSSCFLMKRRTTGRSCMGKRGPEFTKEENNLTGVNSFKFSGLANPKTVSLTAFADGKGNKGVVMTKKITKADRVCKVLVRPARPAGSRKV